MTSNENLALTDPMVSEKKISENGTRKDNRLKTEACLYYKLTHQPKVSGELIKVK